MRISYKGFTPISPISNEKTSLNRHDCYLLYPFSSVLFLLVFSHTVRKSIFMCMILTVNEKTGGANV